MSRHKPCNEKQWHMLVHVQARIRIAKYLIGFLRHGSTSSVRSSPAEYLSLRRVLPSKSSCGPCRTDNTCLYLRRSNIFRSFLKSLDKIELLSVDKEIIYYRLNLVEKISEVNNK